MIFVTEQRIASTNWDPNVEGFYALDDCNGRGVFTHISYNDYEIVDLLDKDSCRVSDRIPATRSLSIHHWLPRHDRGRSTKLKTLGVSCEVAYGARRTPFERGETQGFMKTLRNWLETIFCSDNRAFRNLSLCEPSWQMIVRDLPAISHSGCS